jgi:L-threonylcarbamoyladenylate synthase
MILNGPDAIERAAQTLTAGELAGIPTETVYGLAANAMDDVAVRRS